MILVIGEILFDQFPNYKRIGGAPFNFCFHLKQLGFPVRFISRVGADEDGRELIEHLKKRDFPVDDIQVDRRLRTGLVRVELAKGGVPKFDIVQNVAYDHIDYGEIKNLPDPADVELIYIGSVVQRTGAAGRNLHEFVRSRYPAARVFFDVNLRAGCVNERAVLSSLELAHILKLNDEELEFLKEMKESRDEAFDFVQSLMDEYSLEMLALTSGSTGSELFTRDDRFVGLPVKTKKLADTVGAGDAYASMMAAGTIKGRHPKEIVQKAVYFAARICEIEGAVPDSKSFYAEIANDFGF